MTHWYAVTASSGAEVIAKIAASAIAARCNPIAALRFTIVSLDVLLVSSILNTRLWERRRSTAIVLNVMANERGIGYVSRHQPKKYQRWIGKFANTIDWHPFTSSNVVNMNCGQLYPTQNAVQPKSTRTFEIHTLALVFTFRMNASTEKQEDTIARSSELRCPKWENDRHEPLSGEKHVVVDGHRVEREVLALRVPSVAD